MVKAKADADGGGEEVRVCYTEQQSRESCYLQLPNSLHLHKVVMWLNPSSKGFFYF